MVKSFQETVDLITKVRTPVELFGPQEDANLNEARSRWRSLSRIVHPDVAPGDQIDEAKAAMAKLSELWNIYQKGLTGQFQIATRKRVYNVEPVYQTDEVSNFYPCSWMDGESQLGMLRLPRSPKDNDLIANETKALRALDKGIARFRPYAPEMVDSFRWRDAVSHVDRQAIVTRRLEGFYSLAEVHDAYPDGIDGRDAAWMWRRMLTGAGWAHQAGVVHGAILPQNVLIHPLQHGVVFTNWAYSVTEEGGHVPAIIQGYESWYPESVAAKEAALPTLDIAMIGTCMIFLLNERAPTQFRAFARGSRAVKAAWGSDQAWEVQRDLDDLLTRLYGKRRFRPFSMPGVA